MFMLFYNTALLALASQRAEFLALEWIDTDWTKSILEEMTRKERGSIPGPIECGIILYIISEFIIVNHVCKYKYIIIAGTVLYKLDVHTYMNTI